MKRALIIASVASMIDQFNMGNIKILQKMGYKVDVACNFKHGSSTSKERVLELRKVLKGNDVNTYHVPVPRKLSSVKEMIESYKCIKELILKNKYGIMHCHSPIGGAISRLATKKYRKKGTKVIYTAHGFHFYKGSPILNWMLFYPIEKWLSLYTDVIITINNEDYIQAKKFNSRAEFIPGVGVDVKKFKNVSIGRSLKLEELEIPENSYIILSVGELNKNKNHETVINAVAKLKNPSVHYIICGQGPLLDYLRELSNELGINSQVHFLGYREDVKEIYKVANLFAFPSYREGLGLSAVEAMASGLPLITSNVHGIKDYSINGKTSLTCKPDDVDCFSRAINTLLNNSDFSQQVSETNIKMAEQFDSEIVNKKMLDIYSNL